MELGMKPHQVMEAIQQLGTMLIKYQKGFLCLINKQAFGDYFGPGTALFSVSISDNTSVHAVSSDKKVFLVNKSNTTVSVNVTCNSASTQTSLGPYQVYVMDVPMATTTGTAGSTTAPAVTTGIIAANKQGDSIRKRTCRLYNRGSNWNSCHNGTSFDNSHNRYVFSIIKISQKILLF